MKYSEAMVAGFDLVGWRQSKDGYIKFAPNSNRPVACCVAGAVGLGMGDGKFSWVAARDFRYRFEDEWGVDAASLNDQGMPWEHIYGMARAAGL